MKLSSIEIARGLARIANSNMTNALKLISLSRGREPRDFVLIAVGGGGGMHATALARELGIAKVVIPVNAAVFSALGMLLSDIRRDYIETITSDFEESTLNVINQKIEDISRRANMEFKADGFAEENTTLKFQARLRYRNQEHFVEVDIGADLDKKSIGSVTKAFHETYEREFTYRLDSPVEIVSVHCIAIAHEDTDLLVETQCSAMLTPEPESIRTVDFDEYGIHEAQIYRGETLSANTRINGPAIIEESRSTIVIFPDDIVIKDGYGNYQIELGEQS